MPRQGRARKSQLVRDTIGRLWYREAVCKGLEMVEPRQEIKLTENTVRREDGGIGGEEVVK